MKLIGGRGRRIHRVIRRPPPTGGDGGGGVGGGALIAQLRLYRPSADHTRALQCFTRWATEEFGQGGGETRIGGVEAELGEDRWRWAMTAAVSPSLRALKSALSCTYHSVLLCMSGMSTLTGSANP